MYFKKCNRCGCFYTSNNNFCSNCESQNEIEINALKSYIEDNDSIKSIEDIASNTGITHKNINRLLATNDFINIAKRFGQIKEN